MHLESHRLGRLRDGALDGLTGMRRLHLAHNQISAIEADVFGKAGKLEKVDLSFNRLEQVDCVVFGKLAKLQVLDLSHNRIVKLDFERIKPFMALGLFYVNSNRLTVLGTQFGCATSEAFVQLVNPNILRRSWNVPNVAADMRFVNGIECTR